MRRRYKRQRYADRIAAIRRAMPHCCIGVDVIVGFPGETDEDFQVTQQFLVDLEVSYLHVFTYSERANTLAATMTGVVPMQVRRLRNAQLRLLSQKKRRQFYEQHIGSAQTVLVEAKAIRGQLYGFTENYIKVALPHQENLVNQLVPVCLGAIDETADELVLTAKALAPVS